MEQTTSNGWRAELEARAPELYHLMKTDPDLRVRHRGHALLLVAQGQAVRMLLRRFLQPVFATGASRCKTVAQQQMELPAVTSIQNMGQREMIRMQRPLGKGISTFVVFCSIFAAFLVVSGCAQQPELGTSQGKEVLATPTLSGTPKVAMQITRLAEQAGGGQLHAVIGTYDQEMASVTATISGTVPRTPSQISAAQERVKGLCFQVQRALWTSGIPLQEATVTILGPVFDDYMDLHNAWYGAATLAASAAARIDWSQLSAAKAWTMFEGTELQTEYAPFQRWGTTPSPSTTSS